MCDATVMKSYEINLKSMSNSSQFGDEFKSYQMCFGSVYKQAGKCRSPLLLCAYPSPLLCAYWSFVMHIFVNSAISDAYPDRYFADAPSYIDFVALTYFMNISSIPVRVR